MGKIVNFVNRTTNKILMCTDWYREGFWKGTTKFWSIPSCDYEVVNLGSNSGKYAFCYEDLPVKGMNWAIGPQSLVHDFNILKNYFSYLKEGGIVLIPLCPFSCLHSPYTKESNFKYYPILHPATILDFEDSERTRAYKIKLNPFKEMPLYCIKSTIKEALCRVYDRVKSVQKLDFDKNAEMWIELWKKQFGITDLEAPMSEEHKEECFSRAETLREMIKFCKERNLKPYIVLPPVHSALSSRLSMSFMKNYVYDFIEGVTDDKSLLIDYFYDASFHSNEYFSNSYFMNKKGALIYTERVMRDLELII